MGRTMVLCVLAAVACCAVAGYRHSAVFWPEFGPSGSRTFEVLPGRPDLAEYEARTRERERVARAVAAGHLSLDEAVGAFRRIDGVHLSGSLAYIPGRSPGEKQYRRVIYHVDMIESWSGDNSEIRRRLEEELARRLAAGEFPPAPDDE